MPQMTYALNPDRNVRKCHVILALEDGSTVTVLVKRSGWKIIGDSRGQWANNGGNRDHVSMSPFRQVVDALTRDSRWVIGRAQMFYQAMMNYMLEMNIAHVAE